MGVAPGRYAVNSHDPLYPKLRSLALLGYARQTTARSVPGGSKIATFRVEPQKIAKRNDGQGGRITVGPEFFQSALRDYAQWRLKWWREAIQNGVDAGATAIECGVEELPDGNFRVWCQDNGKGMTRETLLNKFLVLGETGKKDDATARGGFGKAKEMLLLPWVAWRVWSRDTFVDGAGIDYRVAPLDAPMRGTRIEVVMPADNTTAIESAEEFIGRSNLKGVTFSLVSKRRTNNWTEDRWEKTANMKPGKLVREIEGKARLYYDKKNTDNSFYIRTGGLFMFDKWMPSGVAGSIVVELTGRSIDLLTANRDGIRDDELRRALEDFGSELAADTRAALEARGLSRKVYKGTGRFLAEPKAREAALTVASTGALPEATKRADGLGFTLAGATVREIVEALKGVGPEDGAAVVTEVGDVSIGAVPAAVAAVTLATAPIKGQDHLEAALKQMAWTPDFLVLNDREGWKPPKSILPEKMSKRALVLAKLWAELVRFALIRLGSTASYGVGWCFGDSVAAYAREQGENWLLVKPYLGNTEKLIDPHDAAQVRDLWASAIHEVTHMADDVAYHNEAFAGALTTNFGKLADAWPTVERIVAAVIGGRGGDLRRGVEEDAEPPRAARQPKAKPQVVERIVEKLVEVPVERTLFVDRPVPVPTPQPWFEQPVQATGAPSVLQLQSGGGRRPRQQQLGLKLNGRRPMTHREAAAQAKAAAERAVPGRKFVASIDCDDILDVSTTSRLNSRQSGALETAIVRLGWRAWGIGHKGIAFKPTSVRMLEGVCS